MRFNKFVFISFLVMLVSNDAYAINTPNTAISNANNQASINYLLQQQQINYGSNPSNFPLYNVSGTGQGLDLSINKTFGRLYTKIDLSATTSNLSYNASSLGLSNATNYVQQVNARLGYSFYPKNNVALTPYVMLGYEYTQLSTGGITQNSVQKNGMTDFFHSLQYGVGMLGQWVPTSKWVIGGDLTLGSTYNPWFYTNIPLANVPAIYKGTPITLSEVFYQGANLAPQFSWQFALTGDYAITPNLHGLVGVKYAAANVGSGTTNTSANSLNLTVPAQHTYTWQGSIGLGYSFDALPGSNSLVADNTTALINANNLASVSYGWLFQNYGELIPNTQGYLDREEGGIPVIGIRITKTWKNIYGQAALSEAIGNTGYKGALFNGTPFDTTTNNTMTDMSGRLGYQFILSPIFSITPYGVIGYHRWLRAANGIPAAGFLLNAYPETYQNTWMGLGGLFQWAPTAKLVFNLDLNAGNTNHAQVHTWFSFFPTTLINLNLRSRSYVMANVGGDYEFAKKWHVLANVNYWRFNYGASNVNAFGLNEPTSDTRLLAVTLGVGYSLD